MVSRFQVFVDVFPLMWTSRKPPEEIVSNAVQLAKRREQVAYRVFLRHESVLELCVASEIVLSLDAAHTLEIGI